MTKHEKKRVAFWAALKRFFVTNIPLKILALVFAMLLWGYVLTDQKPLRTKTIPDVNLSFEGEAELLAQGFCVRGNREEILQQVSVSVRAQITNYAYLTHNTVNATVSLRNISEAREYTLPIQATVSSSYGTVQSITPATVTVEIDLKRTKTIPVITTFTGELPNGYWADMDAMTTTARIDITGPMTDITRVVRAECVVDLSNRTSTVYSTFDVVLYDADNNVVSSDILIDTLPSSTVRLPIYPLKVVPVDVMGSLIGLDNLAANHELISAVATPSTVRLVGDAAILDTITSLQLQPITVNGLDELTTVESQIIVPENVRMLEDDEVSVVLDVRERVESMTFEHLDIVPVNLNPLYEALFSEETVNLTIEGRYSLVSMIKRGDISIQADLNGLGPGAHTIQLFALVRDEDTTIELTTQLSIAEITVTITAP
jgi:YbbR domain-containing protein